jgi:hypothetical protein
MELIMKEMCFCAGCMEKMMLGTGFYLAETDDGYFLDTFYDIEEFNMGLYLDFIQRIMQSGLDIGKNRWINGYDAYENIDRAVLSRAGIDPRKEGIEESALGGLIAIARSSFIAGLTAGK